MGFEYDPAHRAQWGARLALVVALAFPEATLDWIEYGRRLMVTFPEGATCSIWEPNFYYCRSAYTDAELFAQIVARLAEQRRSLAVHLDNSGTF